MHLIFRFLKFILITFFIKGREKGQTLKNKASNEALILIFLL